MRKLLILAFASILTACTSSPSTVLDVSLAVTNPQFGDHDPVKWDSYRPEQYPVHGIDVSKWQGDINWKTAKRNGVAFAFIKATEGGDHLDRSFKQYWDDARNAGVPRGAYHFYYFCRTAAEQARWFIRNVPNDPKALPPVLDMEWNHGSSCKAKPSPAKIRAEMRTYLGMMKRHYGKKPLVYATVDFYKDNNLGSMKDVEFWLRSVAAHPKDVYPGQRWSFWQYTGTGKIPGIKGETDINVFAGTPKTWREWVAARTR